MQARRTVRVLSLAALTLAVTACCQTARQPDALTATGIWKVQTEIKRQIGVYMVAAANPVATPGAKDGGDSSTRDALFACGRGDIDFDISSVKVDLLSTAETTNDGTLTLKIPVSSATLGPSGEAKGTTTNTQQLVYNLWPLPFERQSNLPSSVTADDLRVAPIAQALLNLRAALIHAAMNAPDGSGKVNPCVTDYDPRKPASDAGDSFKLQLQFVDDKKGGLDVKLGVLDIAATRERKLTDSNTLTVSFAQRGLDKLQRLRDFADAACKVTDTGDPDTPTKKCLEARERFENEQTGIGLGVGFRKSPR